MTLKVQLINLFKNADYIMGIEITRMEFTTRKGGLFSPETIARGLRLLAEEGRLDKDMDLGTIRYRYHQSDYEKIHKKYHER